MRATIMNTRRFVLSCLMAIVMSGFTAGLAAAADCSDYTPGNRPCTATEKFGYCLEVARQSYDECKETGGALRDYFVCGGAYDIDRLACVAALPFSFF